MMREELHAEIIPDERIKRVENLPLVIRKILRAWIRREDELKIRISLGRSLPYKLGQHTSRPFGPSRAKEVNFVPAFR